MQSRKAQTDCFSGEPPRLDPTCYISPKHTIFEPRRASVRRIWETPDTHAMTGMLRYSRFSIPRAS
jgi:hypothetical protein